MFDNVVTLKSKLPTEADKLIGMKLREAREFRKVSQEELGQVIGVSYQQVQKYEAGRNRMTVGTLHQFAGSLKIPVHWFFEGLDAITEGEIPPIIDTDQRRLLEEFDRIDSVPIRRLLTGFVKNLADTISTRRKMQ